MSLRLPPFMSSFLIKVGLLAAGIVCIYFIGWPQSQQVGKNGSPSVLPDLQPDSRLQRDLANSDLITPQPSKPGEQVGLPRTVVLDVNNATQEELERLPGVGTVLAGRIVAFRKVHGPFERVDDLTRVNGIGHKRLDQLRSLVYVKTRKA